MSNKKENGDQPSTNPNTAEEKLSFILDNTPMVAFRCRSDEHRTLTFIKGPFFELTGYTTQDLLDNNRYAFRDIIHSDDLPSIKRELSIQLSPAKPEYELIYRIEVPNCNDRWFLEKGRGIYDQANRLTTLDGVLVDYTSQRQTTSQLHLLSTALDAAGEGFMITDISGKIEFINPAFESITGYQQKELLGKTPNRLKSGIHPPGFFEAMWTSLLAGKIWHGIIVNLTKSGRQIHLEETIAPVYDRHGTIVKFVAIIHDITKGIETETELKQKGDQLVQAHKMEAIGRLAGGVAHDFNNLLLVISNCCEVLTESAPNDCSNLVELKMISQAVNRAAMLTRQLLAFGKKQVIQPKVIDINQSMETVYNILTQLLHESISLEMQYCESPNPIKVDPGQIEQVLMDMAINAQDAMPQGGTLTIKAENLTLDKKTAGNFNDAPPGAYLKITVADTGSGIDAQTINHIFDPFFTTKGVGKGTGLGLSTAYGIITQSQGQIVVQSTPNNGTAFEFILPQCFLPENREEQTRIKITPRTASILLVEDEAGVRILVKKILVKGGFVVHEAENGVDALNKLETIPDQIDILLTDVVMPQMGGRELSEKIVLVRPTIKILFMSGYTDDTILKQGVMTNKANFIQKPFAKSVLIQKIQELMQDPATT